MSTASGRRTALLVPSQSINTHCFKCRSDDQTTNMYCVRSAGAAVCVDIFVEFLLPHASKWRIAFGQRSRPYSTETGTTDPPNNSQPEATICQQKSKILHRSKQASTQLESYEIRKCLHSLGHQPLCKYLQKGVPLFWMLFEFSNFFF